MGTAKCQQKSGLLEDPDVAMYTDVGYSVLTGVDRSNTNFTTLSHSSGSVHVKNGALHHKATLESWFGCKNVKHSFQLCNVDRLEVVQGNITILRKKGHRNTRHVIPMKLGLRIVFKNSNTLVMEMSDAVQFCARLNQYIVSYRLLQHVTKKVLDTKSCRNDGAPATSTRQPATGTRVSRTLPSTWQTPAQRVENIYTTHGAPAGTSRSFTNSYS